MAIARANGLGRIQRDAGVDSILPIAPWQLGQTVQPASVTHPTSYEKPASTPQSKRGGNTRHKTVWDGTKNLLGALEEQLPNIGAVVGIAGLVSLVPVARKNPGIAQAVADVAHVNASKSAQVEVGALRTAWNTIQRGRAAFGQTAAGAALLRVQQPLAIAGLALNGAMLVRDVRRFQNGEGGWRPIVLDAIGLVPAIATGIKSVAGLRAAHAEASAASTAASALDEVEATAVSAIDTALPHVDEAIAVRKSLTEAADISRVGKSIAKDTLDVAVKRRGLSGLAVKSNVMVDRPVVQTAERVDVLKDKLAAVEERAVSALQSTGPKIAGHNNLHGRIDSAVQTARRAKNTVTQLEAESQSLATTARNAEKVEYVGGNATTGVRVVNSGVNLGQSYKVDNSRGIKRNTFDIATMMGMLALGLTGRPVAGGGEVGKK